MDAWTIARVALFPSVFLQPRCCQIHLLLLACRLCLRADVSYFLCCKEIGDVCTQAAVDYEWSPFSPRDGSAIETRARVKSPHRVWPFSRGVISRALTFRSLYCPWGNMGTTRSLLACDCLKGQGHCLGRSSIASICPYSCNGVLRKTHWRLHRFFW